MRGGTMAKSSGPDWVVRCSCGQVELRASGEPISRIVCYCDDCQAGSAQVEALPNARAVKDALGGTAYVLVRKDKVEWVKGKNLIKHYKIRENSTTRRNVASCCNSAVIVDFEGWQPWITLYGTAIVGGCPAPQMRFFTRFAPEPARVPNDVPGYARFPLSFPLKVLRAAASMRLGL